MSIRFARKCEYLPFKTTHEFQLTLESNEYEYNITYAVIFQAYQKSQLKSRLKLVLVDNNNEECFIDEENPIQG